MLTQAFNQKMFPLKKTISKQNCGFRLLLVVISCPVRNKYCFGPTNFKIPQKSMSVVERTTIRLR